MKRIRIKLKGYRNYSFRVLMTCPTEETRNNRLEVACQLGSNTMMWFAVHEDVVNNPFGKVLIRGNEFKEAMKSVPPDVEYNWMQSKNKQERDRFIRENVALQSIVNEPLQNYGRM